MRYAGGGVGHYAVTLTDTPDNPNESREEFAVDEDVIVAEVAGLEDVEEAERIQDDNIEDHGSDSEGEEEDGENPEEDDLGAEDGEGGFLDAEDEEGYAEL